MKRLLIGVLLVSLANEVLSQEIPLTAAYSCKEIMSQLSKGWKEDSMGNGGFRRANAKYILACRQVNLTKEHLIETLGKPNQIREEYRGVKFLYYYYDARTLPKGQDGPLACAYVYFHFREGENTVLFRGEGDTDL